MTALLAQAQRESTHDGLRCPPGESAAGTGHTPGAGSEFGAVSTVTAASTAGAGTGEQAGREPSPMPEGYVTESEAEWQRLKRCEWHLRQVLRAVRLKNVHDRIEQARMFYGPAVLP